MKEPTVNQRRFCEEFLVDFDATQAAIRAGHTKEAAKAIVDEYLNNPVVTRHLAAEMPPEVQDAVIKKLDELLERGLTSAVDTAEPTI